MGGIGGRLSILVREIVRLRGIESDVDEDGKKCEGGGRGGGESSVGLRGKMEVIYVWLAEGYGEKGRDERRPATQ